MEPGNRIRSLFHLPPGDHPFFSLHGWTIDRFGPRVVTLCGLLLVCSGFIGLSFIHSLPAFYITYALLIGLGVNGTSLIPQAASVARWFVKRRAMAIGIAAVGGGLGSTLITPLIFPLVASYGWRMTAVILGLAMFLVGVPMTRIIRPGYPEAYGLRPDGEMPDSTPKVSESPRQSETPPPETDLSVRRALRSSRFWLLVLAWWSSSITLTSLAVHLVPLLTDRGLPVTWVAVAVQVFGVNTLISRFVLPWLADRYDIRWVYATCFWLMSSGLLLLLLTTTNLVGIYLAVALLDWVRDRLFL